jgi:hypothetical protein
VSLPFLFQQALGRSQFEAGFLMVPWTIAVALAMVQGTIRKPASNWERPSAC